MFRKRKKHLGLDIGGAAVRLAIVSPGRKPTAEKLSKLPVPPGAVENGRILDPEALGFAIKSELGPWEGDLFTTIKAAGSGIALRFFKLPLLKKGELEEAVKFESENVLPFRLSEVFWDYEVYKARDHLEVLVAAAEKQTVEQNLAVLSAAGITPQAVELGPLALVRVLRRQLEGETAAVLELGDFYWELTIFSSGRPVFFRLLPGAPQADLRSAAGGEVPASLGELVQDLRRSFDFIGRERNEQVDKLLLAGYGAAVPELAAFFEGQLGLEAVLGDPFGLVRNKSGQTSPEFAVALGLALRGVRP
jgi:type IV pilus assembly protein PilM